ncbi:MAG: hypothetical protein E6G95_22410, partial [Alphaproteobacteria bacterium]
MAIDLALQGALEVGHLDRRAARLDHAAGHQIQARLGRHVVHKLLQAHRVAHAGQRQVGEQHDVGRRLDGLAL